MESELYFDEAGYTGADLMNQDQPYFCLASVCFTDEELNKIKSDIGLDPSRNEIHFIKLHKSKAGRAVLRKLFSHYLLNKEHVVFGHALKRYCIYAQIVNTVIETFFYEHNINIYENRKNLLLANALYSFAVLHANQALVSSFENTFVDMMRNPKVETVAEFYRKTDELRINKDTCEQFQDLLSQIPITITTIKYAFVSNNPFYMDNTLTMFVSIMQKWYEKKRAEMNVKFDESKPIALQNKLIEELRDMDISETLVGYDERKHIYPLPMKQIDLVKSESFFGVQIADAIASAVVFILNNKNQKMVPFQNELKAMPLFQISDVNLAPSTLEYLTKEVDSTSDSDPIDFLCNHLSNLK